MKITAKIKPVAKITAKIKELQMPLSGGFEEGFEQGYIEGEKAGYTNGYETGAKEGAEVGYAKGEADGYEKGHTDGKAEGMEQGFEEGYEKANAENPAYYMVVKGFQWNQVAFPDGFDFVLRLKNKPDDMNAAIMRTTGIKTVKLICDAEGTVNMAQLLRESTAEVLDLTSFRPRPSQMSYFIYLNKKITSILGAIDMSSCTVATIPFGGANALKDVEFVPGTIKISLSFNDCLDLSEASLNSIIDGLADLTGQTAQTLTLRTGTDTRLTDTQKASVTAKNWNLAFSY